MKEYPIYYRKAIKGHVGGRLLDKRGDVEEFLLSGDPSDADADLDDMTVEIKDEDSDTFFKKRNKSAIAQGYLIEISDYSMVLDETNAVSDGYLKDMLKLPFAKMRIRAGEFTSPIPVQRLLDFAVADNKPIKTIELLKTVLGRFSDGSQPNAFISEGGIKVGGVG